MQPNSDIRLKCGYCKTINILDKKDIDIPVVDSEERQMGNETHYSKNIEIECNGCKKDIGVEIDLWEYPPGAINLIDCTENSCVLLGKISFALGGDEDEE